MSKIKGLMSKIKGLLIASLCISFVVTAHADEWVPFMGAGLMPNLEIVQSKYNATAVYPEYESTSGILTVGLDFQLVAGVRVNKFALIARYLRDNVTGEGAVWSRYDDRLTEYERPDGEYVFSEFFEWVDERVTVGAQYLPAGYEGRKLRIYLGGGLGFGTIAYIERPLRSGNGANISRFDYKARTPFFFSQYGEIGGIVHLSKRVDFDIDYQIHHAQIPLDKLRLDTDIEYLVDNWLYALQIGLRLNFVTQ